MKLTVSLGCVFLLVTSPLQAVPHLHPELYPNAKPCHPKQITPDMIKRFGSARAAVISTALGTKNIAVILVQFPSAGSSTNGPSNGAIQSVDTFDSYFASMAAYYHEVSFGKMTLHFSFFGTSTGASPTGSISAHAAGGGFPMPNPMEYYGCGDVDPGCNGVSPVAPSGLGGAYLIHDGIVAARTATTGPTSTASAGIFDAVLVMHAGYGNETTAKNGDVWSAFYQEPTVISANGTTFVDGATFPELESSTITSPLGVMCHEFGHVLTLPDLYNTAVFGGSSVVGKWDLMDAGPYLGGGTNPAHMGAWDKTYLGWATPQAAPSRGSFSLSPIESISNPSGVIKMPVQSGGNQEYFLLEYRSKTAGSFDQYIPGTGLLIWHIDDAITSARGFAATDPSLQNKVNIGSPHNGISIVTQDGLTISNANQGQATNLFSNADNFTSPKSDNFSGVPSGVSVVKIAGVGSASATFEVVNLAVTAGQTIAKVINFPNPAGHGYPHPKGEGYTTLQFQLGRPATDPQINIYTLSGDLVRKIDKNELTLNTDRSTDDKWVYEFDWDLKNGNGQHVAPGVYIYLVRADGQSKSTKAVVIR